MDKVFKRIGLAVTFSPTGKALIKEAKRLSSLFQAELFLIHAGRKDNTTADLFNKLISDVDLAKDDYSVIWKEGDPADAILASSKKAGIDLLIAGALERETLLKYYIGSVARKIMREAESSVLIFKTPSDNPVPFKSFCVSTDFSARSEHTVKTAYNFALLDHANEFILVRDYHVPGLASTVLDSGAMEEIENEKLTWQQEEEEKMKLFVKELNLKGVSVKAFCFYGKEGWETSNYARKINADIFVVTAPVRKLKFLDRLFPHEVEFSFENLPTDLLIIR